MLEDHPDEIMAALVESVEEMNLPLDDEESIMRLLAQVCEIAGFERPEQLEDL